MYKALYILVIILFVLGSVYLTKAITKKYKVNRWIIGFSSPFIVLIPLLIFKELPIWAWAILLIIFSFMCIMFFEITREMVEKNEIKGVAKFDTKKKNK